MGHLRSFALVLEMYATPEIAKLFSLRSKTLLFGTEKSRQKAMAKPTAISLAYVLVLQSRPAD